MTCSTPQPNRATKSSCGRASIERIFLLLRPITPFAGCVNSLMWVDNVSPAVLRKRRAPVGSTIAASIAHPVLANQVNNVVSRLYPVSALHSTSRKFAARSSYQQCGNNKRSVKEWPFSAPEHTMRATGVRVVVLQTLKQVLVYLSTFARLSLSAHSFFTTRRGSRSLAKLKINARSAWRAERVLTMYAAFRKGAPNWQYCPATSSYWNRLQQELDEDARMTQDS